MPLTPKAFDVLLHLLGRELSVFAVLRDGVELPHHHRISQQLAGRPERPRARRGQIMLDAQEEIEKIAGQKMTEFNANERKKMVESGVKFVKFSPADEKAFVDLAYSSQWDKMTRNQSEVANILKGMISK